MCKRDIRRYSAEKSAAPTTHGDPCHGIQCLATPPEDLCLHGTAWNLRWGDKTAMQNIHNLSIPNLHNVIKVNIEFGWKTCCQTGAYTFPSMIGTKHQQVKPHHCGPRVKSVSNCELFNHRNRLKLGTWRRISVVIMTQLAWRR